jgi:hypothetical protein
VDGVYQLHSTTFNQNQLIDEENGEWYALYLKNTIGIRNLKKKIRDNMALIGIIIEYFAVKATAC